MKLNTHLVIPDIQAKEGASTAYLRRIGQYALDKQPAVIVCLGDFADMPSLSSYDRGKPAFEGRRYWKDIEATHKAMDALLEPINKFNLRRKKSKSKQYKPRMVMLLGNHENRINRAVEQDAILEDTISTNPF